MNRTASVCKPFVNFDRAMDSRREQTWMRSELALGGGGRGEEIYLGTYLQKPGKRFSCCS